MCLACQTKKQHSRGFHTGPFNPEPDPAPLAFAGSPALGAADSAQDGSLIRIGGDLHSEPIS